MMHGFTSDRNLCHSDWTCHLGLWRLEQLIDASTGKSSLSAQLSVANAPDDVTGIDPHLEQDSARLVSICIGTWELVQDSHDNIHDATENIKRALRSRLAGRKAETDLTS